MLIEYKGDDEMIEYFRKLESKYWNRELLASVIGQELETEKNPVRLELLRRMKEFFCLYRIDMTICI